MQVGKGVWLQIKRILQGVASDLAFTVVFNRVVAILAAKITDIAGCSSALKPSVRTPAVPEGAEHRGADPWRD